MDDRREARAEGGRRFMPTCEIVGKVTPMLRTGTARVWTLTEFNVEWKALSIMLLYLISFFCQSLRTRTV